MEHGDEDAWLDGLKATPEQIARDMREAREAQRRDQHAPLPDPSIIPGPDFPSDLPGVVRFHCPHGCGWFYEESTHALAEPGRVILPADFTPEDLTGMLALNWEARFLDFRSRVETAITDHYAARHATA
ncbi:hypothetical protein [Kitasatospora sp. NPDC101183]|uniref:hypothetical protein n=1 Tax=Kitasatospora sp. NPDC101183 TaxID=3364100 RepID=UPI00381ABC77